MITVLAWVIIGVGIGVWGCYIDQKKDTLPFWAVVAICAFFGPLSILALIDTWSNNHYVTGIPWYKQSRQMAVEYKKHEALAADKKEELLKKHTISQVYTVVLEGGKTIKQSMQYQPYVQKTYAPEYYYCWDITSQKDLQKNTIAKLKKHGVVGGETVYPWHTVVEVIFDE